MVFKSHFNPRHLYRYTSNFCQELKLDLKACASQAASLATLRRRGTSGVLLKLADFPGGLAICIA